MFCKYREIEIQNRNSILKENVCANNSLQDMYVRLKNIFPRFRVFHLER